MIDRSGSRTRAALVVLAGVLALVVPACCGILGAAILQLRQPAHTVTLTSLSEPVPQPGDPVGRPTQTLTRLLTGQGAALMRGDQAGWLAAIDQGNAALVTDFTRMFTNLRTMGVTSWQPAVDSVQRERTASMGTAKATFGYCLHLATCPTAADQQGSMRPIVKADLGWGVRSGALVITSFASTGTFADDVRQYPWQTDDLVASVGARSVVAAAPSLARMIPSAVAAADRAAAHVDPFSLGGQPPASYTIYLAGPAEWHRWFMGEQDDYIGYAVATSRVTWDIVLQIKQIESNDLEATIRHEMGHVVTLRGWHTAEQWWLVEGTAEYIAYGDRPAGQYAGLSAARQFARGSWDGHLAVQSAAGSEGYLRYAMAYMSVRALIDRYGLSRFLDFFDAVVLRNNELDVASQQSFGAPWSTVDSTGVADVRRLLR